METADLRQPNRLAKRAMSSALALPSTGAALSCASHPPSSDCSSPLCREFGLTLTRRSIGRVAIVRKPFSSRDAPWSGGHWTTSSARARTDCGTSTRAPWQISSRRPARNFGRLRGRSAGRPKRTTLRYAAAIGGSSRAVVGTHPSGNRVNSTMRNNRRWAVTDYFRKFACAMSLPIVDSGVTGSTKAIAVAANIMWSAPLTPLLRFTRT